MEAALPEQERRSSGRGPTMGWKFIVLWLFAERRGCFLPGVLAQGTQTSLSYPLLPTALADLVRSESKASECLPTSSFSQVLLHPPPCSFLCSCSFLFW